MHFRFRSFVVVACLAGLTPLVPVARAESKTPPTFVLRLKSIDGLLGDVEFLAAAAGKENEAAQFGGLVRGQKGPKGIFGIDTTRPIGMYAKLSQDLLSSASVVLVPISDQDALLSQLAMFGIQPNKDKDGSYSLAFPGLPVQVHFKFANKYLYLTAPTKEALAADKLLNPSEVLPANDKSLVSGVWNLDQIPDNLRQMILQQFDNALSLEKNKKQPGENETQRKVRVQTIDAFGQQFAAVIKEGGRLELHVNVDQKGKELTADISFAGAAGSSLAKSIAELGRSQSLFGGLVQPNAAVSILVHLGLPDAVRQALAPAIDEQIGKDIAKEKDAAKRALAEQLLNAIKPSLKAGELDGLVQLSGPSSGGNYDLVAALKIKEGAKVAAALRTVANALPAAEKALIHLDAEKAGTVSIHRLDAQSKYDAQAKALFGDNPVYVAVLPEAVLLSGGPKGLDNIKAAAALTPKSAPQFSLAFSMRGLAPLIAHDKKNAAAVPAAEKAFGTGKDNDTIVVTVQGGTELKARVVVKTPVLRFVAEVGEKAAR